MPVESISNRTTGFSPNPKKPSKAELLAQRKMTLKAQLADLRYGFVEREVTLLSSSQTAFIRYGIDGRGREQARTRLLRPLNRTIRETLNVEKRNKTVDIARGRDLTRLIQMRDSAELHHIIPVSLLPIDEAPAGNFGDQIAWWQETAHRELNLVSVDAAEHTLIHNYLFAQGIYSIAAQQKADLNISQQPVVVSVSVPVKPGSLWMGSKPAPLNS